MKHGTRTVVAVVAMVLCLGAVAWAQGGGPGGPPPGGPPPGGPPPGPGGVPPGPMPPPPPMPPGMDCPPPGEAPDGFDPSFVPDTSCPWPEPCDWSEIWEMATEDADAEDCGFDGCLEGAACPDLPDLGEIEEWVDGCCAPPPPPDGAGGNP